MKTKPKIVVLIPCYNEEVTIAQTVSGMRAALPDADIHVYDNNSTDNTVAQAQGAGAIIRVEKNQGKGNVIRRMFADIEADAYLMVDGDNTYDASAAPGLIRLVLEDGIDFVNGARRESSVKAYRTGHKFGNYVLTMLVRKIFGEVFTDMLSGYKCFSRRYVKSFPALSHGFEIETELTIHALELRMPCQELTTRYGERPEGSASKLKTYQDGLRILITILRLVKEERPLQLFTSIGVFLIVLAFAIAIPIFNTYFHTGLVPRLPTALLSTGLVILGSLSIVMAVIMDSIVTARQEIKRIAYLGIPLFSFSNARSNSEAKTQE
jgi:glycosyltransferase involved in cell wall biosynthesis